MKNRYFEVTAKCGHVGRHQYYEGRFYECTSDAATAAAKVKMRPRVKHNHKDAILYVMEITFEDYISGQKEFDSNPYYHCKSKWHQRLVWDKIVPYLRPETEMQHSFRRKSQRLSYMGKPRIKRPYKRERLALCDYDLALYRGIL